MSEFEGAWKEFKEWESKEHARIYRELESINTKIDQLREFRWRLMGQVSLASFFTAGVTATVLQYLIGRR